MIQDHKSMLAQTAYCVGGAQFLDQFQPLIRKLAWHLAGSAGPTLDVDDLMQVGAIALAECAQRHDRDNDDGLAAYVQLRVRGAMIDAIRKAQLQSRSARAERKAIEKVRDRLAAQLVREPTEKEIANEMGISTTQLADMRWHSQPMTQMELNDCYDDQSSFFTSSEPNGEEMLLAVENKEQLADAIAALPERHKLVIQLYFLEELNLSEIAAVLDVSVPRVHQVKSAAIAKLREWLER